MKRALLIAILLAAIFLPGRAETAREVLYFYENYCASCDPEGDFAKTFYSLTGESLENVSFSGYNVVEDDGREVLERTCEQYGVENPRLPLTIVDGQVYNGEMALREELPNVALEWKETTDSVVLYLYVPNCESCARARKVIDELPENVVVRRGNLTYSSSVRVEMIDMSAEPTYAEALFEAYGVPEEKCSAPCVFFAKRYLAGADDIEKYLPVAVRNGSAAGGTLVARTEVSDAQTLLSAMGSIGAGLVAGLNTCALSMLLMFLSIIVKTRKQALLLAMVYLLIKFLCYLLIGFVLLGMVQQLNLVWLRTFARWALTALGVILIGMNLRDAWNLRRGDLAKVRNQLPAQLRGRLHSTIRRLTQSKVLVPATALLAVIVAFGEFLCAGQIYLMHLLSAVQTDARAQSMNLVIYCLAFIAPSVVISAIVVRVRSGSRLSAFLADHMAAVKVITAVAMSGIIAYAWLI